MNRRTNGIINEALAMWWGSIKALCYATWTRELIVEKWDGDTLIYIAVAGKVFYERGKYD